MAQAQIFSGKIIDQKQQTLEGAAVGIVETGVLTISDSLGAFSLPVERNGSFTLQVTAPGFTGYSKTFSQAQQELRIQLKRIPIPEVTIEAIRGSEDLPITQTTLSRQEIEEEFYGQDATAILSTTPNVQMNFQSGFAFSNYSDIRLRGMDQTRINITLNGVPLNDALDQGVFFSNFTDFMNSIESVQVQRGVGTSTNGQASYAGSINFESLNIRDTSPSVELQTGIGSFHTRRASLEANTGLMDNNFAAYAKYSLLRTDGFRDHSGTIGESFFFSTGYFGKSHALKLTGFVGRTKNELAYLPEDINTVRENPRFNQINRNATDDFGQDQAQLQHTWRLSDRVSLATTAYVNWAGGDFDVIYPLTDSTNAFEIYTLENIQPGLLSVLRYTQNTLELDAGIHGNRFYRTNVFYNDPRDREEVYKNLGVKNEFSAFVKALYRLNKWSFFGDLQVRYTDIQYDSAGNGGELTNLLENRQFTFLNPKAGLRYQISPFYSLYGSIGYSGREPSRRDLLAGEDNLSGFNSSYIPQNWNNADAEFVTDLELGLELQKQQWAASLNGYYMWFDGEILPTGEITPFGEFLRRNVESSFRRGIEASVQVKPTQELTIRANGSFNDAEIESFFDEADSVVRENITPLMTPTWLAFLEADYRLPYNFKVGLSGRYVGEAFLGNTNNESTVLPDYFILGVQLGYFSKHLQVDLRIFNMTNERYYTFGTDNAFGFPGQFVFVGAERSFMLTTSLSF